MSRIPLFIRKFVLDSVETFVGLVLAMSIVFPGSVEDAQALGLALGASALAAIGSAARRAAPAFLTTVALFLGVSQDASGSGQ